MGSALAARGPRRRAPCRRRARPQGRGLDHPSRRRPPPPPVPAAAPAAPAYAIFFDAAATQGRVAVLEKAIAADKHVYCEKPLSPTATQGVALLREAQRRGVKHGVVEDKIHLPGLQKLAALTRAGALGRVAGF